MEELNKIYNEISCLSDRLNWMDDQNYSEEIQLALFSLGLRLEFTLMTLDEEMGKQ